MSCKGNDHKVNNLRNYQCAVYRAGFQEGREDGFENGYEDGFAAGRAWEANNDCREEEKEEECECHCKCKCCGGGHKGY